MPVRKFPMAIDYVQAVGDQERAFRNDELRTARFTLNSAGIRPLAVTGANAVVFRADIGGSGSAVRCFTYMDDQIRARYVALSEYLAGGRLSHWLPATTWLDDAIEVNGDRWPVVRMDWVEGSTLDTYVAKCVANGDVQSIARLARQWRAMIGRIQESGLAHGDLQHNNVIVDEGGGLHLIDFDGVWLPAVARLPPPFEVGHPNYQRADRQWNRWMDTFPGLVVYLSLAVLAQDPGLWESLHTSESMLFAEGDFDPTRPTEVWRRLDAMDGQMIRTLAGELRRCCQPDWPARGFLATLLPPDTEWWRGLTPRPPRQPGPLLPPQRPQPAAEPPPTVPTPRPTPRPAPPVMPAARPDGAWWGGPTGARPPVPHGPPAVPSEWSAGARRRSPAAAAVCVAIAVAVIVITVVLGQPLLAVIGVVPVLGAVLMVLRK